MKRPHDRRRLEEYLQALIEGKYTLRHVSAFTGYTREHLCRLKKRYQEEGPGCLINGHTGKPGPTRIPQEERDRIARIYREEFVINGAGANFAYFWKALQGEGRISCSYNAACAILAEAGIESPARRGPKGKGKACRPRLRKGCEGEMLQMDASPHPWLEWAGDSGLLSLHGAIDDAKSLLTGLSLARTECAYGYYSVLEQTFRNYGLPMCISTDRAAVFAKTRRERKRLTQEERKAGLEESRTQLQRILKAFGIAQQLALAARERARIERIWLTLQGRLPFEFKRHGIRTIKEANRFLQEEFLPAFNAEFALKAEKPKIWRVPPAGWKDELCSRYARKADNAAVISFMNCKIHVPGARAGQKLEVCVFPDRIAAFFDGRLHEARILEAPEELPSASDALRAIIARHLLADLKGRD